MAGDSGTWCLIESDPGVFTELIQDLGVSGAQVEELWSLDDGTLEQLGPVFGLIFLFKWERDQYTNRPDIPNTEPPYDLFFARQVINNACATQAILSIILNSQERGIELGEQLAEFKSFVSSFDPETKGYAISNMDSIRTTHNSFAQNDPFVNEMADPASKGSSKDDPFHFISFIPYRGRLWELDGLWDRPIDHGECDETNWTEKAKPVIQERMARYAGSEIRFNLMAVIKNRQETINEQLEEVEAKLLSLPEGSQRDGERFLLEEEKSALVTRLSVEEDKMRRYKRENTLRKHNFIPMIYTLAKELAKNGQLEDLIIQAKRQEKIDMERERQRRGG